MRDRREFSKKVKTAAALRANDHCEGCGRKFKLYEGREYDHEIPDALGGENTTQNCRVLCRSCHGQKTQTADIPRIAKANRNYRKARGIKNASRFPFARGSKLKRKISGEVVER
jgi:5-methylcytosine-specific restriction endonuclease McrA